MILNRKYIAARIGRSVYGEELLVQGQRADSLNWDTLTRYPVAQQAIAEIDACNKARKFSETVGGSVTAYDLGGYGMKTYIGGVEFVR